MVETGFKTDEKVQFRVKEVNIMSTDGLAPSVTASPTAILIAI